MGLYCAGPLVCGVFSVNTYTVFNPWLGVRGYEGPAVRSDLRYSV